MPDKKTTVTDEMRKAARDVLRAFVSGPRQGMIGVSELARSAAVEIILTAALDAAPTTDADARRPLTDTIDFAALWKQERARAEKAEQERDEARKSLHEANETVKSLRAMTARDHLNAARDLGHPLPKGATIPEGAAFWVRPPGEPWEFVSPGPDEDFDTSPFPNSQYVLLDPPTPKRPDGAEEIEGVLAELDDFGGDVEAPTITYAQRARLADLLAPRVRVVSEEDPR